MNKKPYRLVLAFFIILVVIVIIGYIVLCGIKKNESKAKEEPKEIYKSSSNVFSDSKLIETTENKDYNKDAEELKNEDFVLGKLKCNVTTIADVLSELGKPSEIWKCEGEGYVGVNYVQYKYSFKDEGLIVYCDFDNKTSVLKTISTYHEKKDKEVIEKTTRNIGIGSSYKDAIHAYPSGEKIYSYENNNGVYKVLYGVDSFFKVINEGESQKDKNYAYMYYADGKIDGLYYVSNGRTISFAIDEDEKISDIYINIEINEN